MHGAILSLPQYAFMAWCLVKHRDNFTFYLYLTKEMRMSTHITCSMITESFYEKADLEQWLKPDIHREDYKDLTDKIWVPLVQKNLSFLIKDANGEPVGVALNFDAHDEPTVEIASKLAIVFDFLEFLEHPIRYCRLKQREGFRSDHFMMIISMPVYNILEC
jgi:hypothetical protein